MKQAGSVWMRALRLAPVALLAVALAGAAAASALGNIRGPLAPSWVESITHAESDRVGRQFDIALALQKKQVLPKDVCWPCRARDALKSDPLGAKALRTLGLFEEEAGNHDQAARYLDASLEVSRRDPVAQIWLFEYNRQEGKTDEMLANYDNLLSVDPDLSRAVAPRLNSALDDEGVQRSLARYIRLARPWTREYLESAVSTTEDPLLLAKIFRMASAKGAASELSAPYERELVSSLAAGGHFAESWDFAERLLGEDSNLLGDYRFTNKTVDPSLRPLLWTPGEDGGVAVSLAPDDGLRVDALSGSSGIAVYRIVPVTGGVYRFAVNRREVVGEPPLQGRWQVACIAPRVANLAIIQLTRAQTQQASVQARVPSGCEVVRITLEARNLDGSQLKASEFDSLVFRKLSS